MSTLPRNTLTDTRRLAGCAARCLHRVSEKNCANFFSSEFRQISTNFDKFWQKDGKGAKIV